MRVISKYKLDSIIELGLKQIGTKYIYGGTSTSGFDCISFALLDLFKYWDRFNPAKTTNAFSFFTQVAKNGYAKGWNKLHPGKYKGTISLSGSNDSDSEGVYSI